MAAISTLVAVAGLALSAGGMMVQMQASQRQAEAQEKALQQQMAMEEERRKQMNLDAARRRRELVRNSLAAQARATAITTAQGAGATGSRAPGGATGSILGRANTDIAGVNMNQDLSNRMFSMNSGLLGYYRDAAAAGSQMAMGSGLASLGGALMRSNETIGRVGGFVMGTRG